MSSAGMPNSPPPPGGSAIRPCGRGERQQRAIPSSRMIDRLRPLAHDPRVQRSVDVLIALCIFIASLADLLHGGRGSGWGGPLPLELLLAFAISVPLLWR